MNTIIQKNQKNILNIFFTAGYPYTQATTDIILALQQTPCNIIEVGIPFSDPLADGPTIQKSSQIALQNGITIHKIFQQIQSIKAHIKTPIILMGYLNPILQFGMEKFLKKCHDLNIAGTILPDLPLDIYQQHYLPLYKKYNIHNIFLITPQTPTQRIHQIDKLSNAFIYLVSSNATTGKNTHLKKQQQFYQHIASLKLKNPILIGFGIKNKTDFNYISKYANGAIIGSAFINAIQNTTPQNISQHISQFVSSIKTPTSKK